MDSLNKKQDDIYENTDNNINVISKDIASIANGNTNLFTITGVIEMVGLYGVVKTATEDAVCTYKFDMNDGFSSIDLCTATSIQLKSAGAKLSITGDFADALTVTPVCGCKSQVYPTILQGAEQLYVRGVASAAITGEITFYMLYRKISENAEIT